MYDENVRSPMTEAQFNLVVRDLFHIPRFGALIPGKRFRFDGAITTDGVSACFLFAERVVEKKRKPDTCTKNGKKKPRIAPPTETVPIIVSSSLSPGIYEHGKDFWLQPDDSRTYLFVDPGHVNIMSGVFEHFILDAEEQKIAEFDPKTAKHYSMTNRWYRANTGMKRRAKRAETYRQSQPLLVAAMLNLSNNSSKTWDPGKYRAHLGCVLKHWSVLFDYAFTPKIRHDRLTAYQDKQRIVHKIDAKLKEIDPKIVLVVGSGVSSATSRGHDSAPGKQLRARLAQFMPVIMTPEQFTSKKAPCCRVDVYYGKFDSRHPTRPGKRIRGLSHCQKCGLTFDRDFAAAVNIRAIFWHQASERTRDNILETSS